MSPEPISLVNLSIWFQNWILFEGANLKLARSFVRYLTDLKIITFTPPDNYYFSNKPNAVLDKTLTPDTFINILKKESDTKKGFAIGYFLRLKEKKYIPKNLPESFCDQIELPVKKAIFSTPGKACDLSNLQVVKKVGKQLLPFLELEQKYISNLKGDNVTKDDAKRLFQHILTHIREKGEPKKWEQLSKRRHK